MRIIDVPSTVTSYYEGVYQIEVLGYSLDHAETATETFEFTIFADCSAPSSILSPPQNYQFDCIDKSDPTGARLAFDDIHHYLRTDETFIVDLF